MAMFSRQQELYQQGAQAPQMQMFTTIGTVVDTNDPQQMGRVRILCPQWGDTWNAAVEDLPWAVYMSPFGGHMQTGTRGPGIQESEGSVSYGMWAIPKVGAQAVVMCVDGNPMTRIYLGCIFEQFTPHTLPHGRYMYDDHPELEDTPAAPYGPFTSSEKLIQPLASNQQQAFGNRSEPNYEYRTRGADYSASRVDIAQLSSTYSKVQDDSGVVHDSWTSTNGYQVNRSDPHAPSSYTDKNYDNATYSFTSPGFHSLSMDDRQENCRVRLRTTSGHQIIMDDTNERIYVATARGNNWIEMDQDGNIDVFTTTRLNVHAAKDINMTADETIRLHSRGGIHMHADGEIRMDSGSDTHVKAANIRSHSSGGSYFQADGAMHMKADGAVHLESGSDFNVLSGGNLRLTSTSALDINAGSNLNMSATSEAGLLGASGLKLTSGADVNILGAGQVLTTGSMIHFNGPPASPATAAASSSSASEAGEQQAFWTSRVPEHEPYARTLTRNDFTHEPEYEYTSADVNRVERGRRIDRGMYWRR